MNCSARSLKLLDMSFLVKKLGFKHSNDEDRITTSVDYGYNDKVLVGDWLKRSIKEVKNTDMELQSVYMVDYQHRSTQLDTISVWNNRFNAQGNLPLRQGKDDEFQDNMASIYDLAYRCKVRDFVDGNYGNTTNYGKKECKQSLWDTQKDIRKFDRQLRFHTEYRDTFSYASCLSHTLN